MLNNNINEINHVRQIVEETYNNQLKNLNNEKNSLLAILDDCKKDK